MCRRVVVYDKIGGNFLCFDFALLWIFCVWLIILILSIWKINVCGKNFDVSRNILIPIFLFFLFARSMYFLWCTRYGRTEGWKDRRKDGKARTRGNPVSVHENEKLTRWIHRPPNYCLRERKERMCTLLLSSRVLRKMRITCGLF